MPRMSEGLGYPYIATVRFILCTTPPQLKEEEAPRLVWL